MICQRCQGEKTIHYCGMGACADLPCDECGGTGIVSCCEGRQEAPRPEDDVVGSPRPGKHAGGAPCGRESGR